MIRKIVAYILFFLLIFDLSIPPIKSLGSAVIVFVVISIKMFLDKEVRERCYSILHKYRDIVVLYSVVLLYVLLRITLTSITEKIDSKYIFASLKSIIVLLASLFYVATFKYYNHKRMLFNIFFVNAVIALTVGYFSEYKYLVNFFKPNGLATQLVGYIPFRDSFLAGSGYFGIGAPYAIVISFFLGYFVLYEKGNLKKYIMLFVMFVAGVFAARTLLFCVLYMILYLILVRRKFKLLLPIFLLTPILMYLMTTPMFLFAKMWLMQAIGVFVDTSSSSSLNNLTSDMIKLPDNAIPFLFGDGRYNSLKGGYYMHTDIGYLRHLFFGGVFFVILTLLIPFGLYLKNRNLFFLMGILPIVFILHFKGVLLLNSPIGMPVLIIISHILGEHKKD